jgi:hypothetical protein
MGTADFHKVFHRCGKLGSRVPTGESRRHYHRATRQATETSYQRPEIDSVFEAPLRFGFLLGFTTGPESQ